MTGQKLIKYGLQFEEGVTSDLDIELYCYSHDDRPENTGGRLTRFQHFKNAVDILWNYEGSTRRIIWNRWTERMIHAMIYHKYVGLAGAGSSGKSDAAALFCLVEWLSAPSDTLCLVCSTTLTGARKRIWKSVNELWNSLSSKWEKEGKILPGKMVDSKGMLVAMDENGKWSEAIGITLIAAGKDDEKEADKKLKGLKAPAEGRGRLRLVADEFSDLGYCVYVAMMGNLNTNPDFKGIGMSNPGSKLTPFGKFVEPRAGWNSLVLGMEQWETRHGVCLSFDAHYSPRLTEPGGDEKYIWMPSQDAINIMKEEFGEDSVEYWAQVRGMFCPTGMERTIWSEAELLDCREKVQVLDWDGPTKNLIALDPGFTTDGDRSPIMWAECGKIRGVKVMNILGYTIASDFDSENANPISPSEHVINQFITAARNYNVPANRAAYDATGGGTVFGQWLATKWSQDVLGIRFGEAPKERRADSKNFEVIYANRVTQLWVQPKALVRQKQIRGIDEDVIEELCSRRYDEKKNNGKTVCIESKRDMKKRIGKSPDLADCFVILVECAIQNGLLDVEEIKSNDRKQLKAFQGLVMGSHAHLGKKSHPVIGLRPKSLTFNRLK